ncbi:hypothetical protein D3C85_1325400 [compost metagenome]
MLAAELIEGLHHAQRAELLAIHGNHVALNELKLYIFRFIRCVLRRYTQKVHVLAVLCTCIEPRIFQHSTLIANVQQIAVGRIRLGC